ncbi:MAG: HD domain-containing protein, partial [Bacteroidota bacterium]
FQRLRRIKQLGLTEFVYPGALHTRFHHALGAMHLMGIALQTLQSKGYHITEEEKEAARIAILLHDVGHGPFSHALESTILQNIPHERLSLLLMEHLNKEFGGQLSKAIEMFKGTYARPFFHQLIASQLDMDRLDYLQRDSFFTGVLEGTIGAERILKMLALEEDHLVVEEKGIYSLENFLTARRLMYWQVYLHRTTMSAEKMIINIIKRARYLTQQGYPLTTSKNLAKFMKREVSIADFEQDTTYVEAFASLDDYDVWGGVKAWIHEEDRILTLLCKMLLHRKLFKLKLHDDKIPKDTLQHLREEVQTHWHLTQEEIPYFFEKGTTENAAYKLKTSRILIKTRTKGMIDIAEASDLPNIKALTKIVKKYYVCWSQTVSL